MLNKVQIIGYLGRDPEGFDTKSGRGCNLSVATTRTWKDKSGQKQEDTEWHRVVCFSFNADFALDYLSKGRLVYVEGRLQTSQYEKNGEKRYSTQIVADRVLGLDRKGSGNGGSGSKQQSYDDDVDDVPF